MMQKKGVILSGLQFEMRKALQIYQESCTNIDVAAEVTSGLEGEHSAGSYHYYGYALDFSIHGMTDGEIGYIAKELKSKLGPLYDVVVERDHIHVEFDVMRAKLAGYKKEF